MGSIYVFKNTWIYSLIFCLLIIPAYSEQKYERKSKTQPDNIVECFSCFLKGLTDWSWEQEKRLGMRDDPKYVTCRRVKRVRARDGSDVCVYKGANNTWALQVEFNCPQQFQCIYDPGNKEPNIDSVVDSINSSFKK